MLALTAASLAAVVIAVFVRVSRADDPRWRAPAFALAAVTPVAIALFTLAEPLQHGWARRAGTPANLLASSARPVAVSVAGGSARTGSATRSAAAAPASNAPAGPTL